MRTQKYCVAPLLGPDQDNVSKPDHLEEEEVVARFLEEHLRKNHYHIIQTLHLQESIAGPDYQYTCTKTLKSELT